jgi:hypothetical protein
MGWERVNRLLSRKFMTKIYNNFYNLLFIKFVFIVEISFFLNIGFFLSKSNRLINIFFKKLWFVEQLLNCDVTKLIIISFNWIIKHLLSHWEIEKKYEKNIVIIYSGKVKKLTWMIHRISETFCFCANIFLSVSHDLFQKNCLQFAKFHRNLLKL